MPFIWDDKEHKFVKKDEYYDSKRYIVVRRLFVLLKLDMNVSIRNQSKVLRIKSGFGV